MGLQKEFFIQTKNILRKKQFRGEGNVRSL